MLYPAFKRVYKQQTKQPFPQELKDAAIACLETIKSENPVSKTKNHLFISINII